jgi:uncharacterized transporter YbjL
MAAGHQLHPGAIKPRDHDVIALFKVQIADFLPVANELGNAQQKLQQVQMLPVFIGIGLGVLLGSIPLFIPGFPAALKLWPVDAQLS